MSEVCSSTVEVFDDVAYVYDGTLEGLLSSVFEAYINKEDPADVVPAGLIQLRLAQRIFSVSTNWEYAERVRRGIIRKCGRRTFFQIAKASVSSRADAGVSIYRFIRYAMDKHKGRSQAISNISHPAVSHLFEITRSVDNECEHIRQFARFEHLKDDGVQVWFAKVNPKDSVVPLVLGHFVERFNVQPFIIFDEVHGVAGVWDGIKKRLVQTDSADILSVMPMRSATEIDMQEAWRTFYRSVSIDSRYNPELRRHFMPMRFWRNITEMQIDETGLKKI
ncbi:TIGR03915 family putative DNA repair protein [Adlercreutzia sp. ZJ304]|uniref:TIGR03915 family putative DNA repair protein n=1 Tax=Adlercreutzia sp. ZJ304 TaxID=2709791 RepID=UPI0013ECFBD9|nr:TIGR03915 family putative DNA repair protein [Adlercreutzia sp. ZJ304]